MSGIPDWLASQLEARKNEPANQQPEQPKDQTSWSPQTAGDGTWSWLQPSKERR